MPSPLSSLSTPPNVLFRVECHDVTSPYYNNTFQDGHMVPRGPNISNTSKAFDDCLSWQQVKTPFIPFFSSWKRALHWRRRLISKGVDDIVIIAIWSGGMLNVYDAYNVAKSLGYQKGSLNQRKRLENHIDEYLVMGVYADDYRILGIFEGQSEYENVPIAAIGIRGSVTVPDGFLMDVVGTTMEEKLEIAIYQHTGIRGSNSVKLRCLIRSMLGINYN